MRTLLPVDETTERCGGIGDGRFPTVSDVALGLPKVSVILPFRNEEAILEASVISILEQDYPGAVEVLAVDDGSSDKSPQILKRLMLTHRTIRLIPNKNTGEAPARNAAISEATGQVIVNFSAHAVAPRDFLNVLVSKLNGANEDIAGVGSKHKASSDGRGSNAFGLAERSAFGGLGTTYHEADTEHFAESVAFTAYRARIFKEIGLFDPRIERGADAEFNLRLAESGYRLLYTPKTFVYHSEAHSIQAFLTKMIGYGAARAKVTRMYPWSFRAIYVLPSLALATFFLLSIGSLFDARLLIVLIGLIVVYVLCSSLSAAKLAWQEGIEQILRVMIAFPLIHAGYGMGFLLGGVFPF